MTKIATRIKSAVTGEEYYIGTTGLQENVRVKLTTPQLVDWTQYNITVQNISKSTSATYDIDAQGHCTFKVPMGDIYNIILPIVSDYVQPSDIEHVATLASRVVTYLYSVDSRTELISVTAHVQSLDGDTVSILEGLPIIATDTLGNNYIGYFTAQGTCNTIEIPYGQTYNLAFPSVGGYTHDHNGEHHTAGLPSREIQVHYQQVGVGVFGIDADGNKYTIDQIIALADKSIIIAGGYNDAVLAASPRGDGSYGNGFCWKIGDEIISSKQWSSSDVTFDTTRLPNVGDLGTLKYSGKHMTDMIIEIGGEISATTPAASTCASKILTINNVDREGFYPTIEQFKIINTVNITAFLALYTALGLTAPAITSGQLWTSCQRGTDAVMSGGGVLGKSGSRNVFVCYDLG